MRIKLAALVLAHAFALPAQAGPVGSIDWGQHASAESAAFQLQGKMQQIILFVVDEARGLSVSVSADHERGANADKGGSVALYKEAGDIDALMGSHDFDWQSAGAARLFELQPGSYYYQISRSGPGSNGGRYALSSSLDAAPAGLVAAAVGLISEPSGLLLALGALAALAAVKLRRRGAAPASSHTRGHAGAYRSGRRLVL
jgi:hypothetical protein